MITAVICFLVASIFAGVGAAFWAEWRYGTTRHDPTNLGSFVACTGVAAVAVFVGVVVLGR